MERLRTIPYLATFEHEPLRLHTRFGIGGEARVYATASRHGAFVEALRVLQGGGIPWVVIGGGTNLVVSDEGFPGVVLRLAAPRLRRTGEWVRADAGAELQALVDFSVSNRLSGLETMTGIPGSVGAAVYGNAGAYGHSIDCYVERVVFFDGASIRSIDNARCQFRYRESVFKKNKRWIVLRTLLRLHAGDGPALARTAAEILAIRNKKYPPDMKCAGSIFKNLLLGELPEAVQLQVPAGVVREGKVPSAYFLEACGAKGLRSGGIQVADYHANLIYNAGGGTAIELRRVILDLKRRVHERFGLALEEEVQYVGFDPPE